MNAGMRTTPPEPRIPNGIRVLPEVREEGQATTDNDNGGVESTHEASSGKPMAPPPGHDCGCGYELSDWNGIQVKQWFHEPECPHA